MLGGGVNAATSTALYLYTLIDVLFSQLDVLRSRIRTTGIGRTGFLVVSRVLCARVPVLGRISSIMICISPRATSPHQDSAGTGPQRHTAAGTAGTAAPTTTDTGNTVPQCADPTQKA